MAPLQAKTIRHPAAVLRLKRTKEDAYLKAVDRIDVNIKDTITAIDQCAATEDAYLKAVDLIDGDIQHTITAIDQCADEEECLVEEADKVKKQFRMFSMHAAAKGGLAMRARLQATKREGELRDMASKRREKIEWHLKVLESLQLQRHKALSRVWAKNEVLQKSFEACGLHNSLAMRPGMRSSARGDDLGI